MSAEFQTSDRATTQKSFKNKSFGEKSKEIAAAPNRFPDTANEDESHEYDEIKTILDNEMETKNRDEPQYSRKKDSIHKVSSCGSLYRLSQVSLHSVDNYNTNSMIPRTRSMTFGSTISDQYIDVVSDADISCTGKNITDCIGLHRIISILVFYSNNYNNYEAINKYLEIYNMKKHLVNDYIHILDKHLNEDNISKLKSDKHFTLIYKTLIDKSHLYCDITKCYIYQRNHRQREIQYITPQCEDYNIAMIVDILDGIHCYFIHSVDMGYKIINHNPMYEFQHLNQSDDIYNSIDNEMNELTLYLKEKQRKLKQIHKYKSKKQYSRFITKLTNNSNTILMTDNNNEKDENNIQMEGYLKKESMYLKHLRLRYIVLSGDCLYSYKTHKKEDLTESIDLKQYNRVQISADGPIGQFELVCGSGKKNKKRVLIASCMQELDDWLKAFKQCINIINNSSEYKSEHNTNHLQNDKEYEFGERYDYWSPNRIYPKYESIKEEVTTNRIYSISMISFNNAFNKSKFLINSCDKIRNMMTCSEVLDKYNFPYDTVIRIDHILALVLWTDYRHLSHEFRNTFTKISKKIYDEFWIWSKFLIEAVNAFGVRLKKAKVKTCYHSIVCDNKYNKYESYIYHTFHTTFNMPTSATTKLEIVLLNAMRYGMNDKSILNNGIILELGHNNEERFSKKMRYFNCSFVSAFGYENERLSIQPPDNKYYFYIISIRNIKTNENYYKYMQCINILQKLFSNQMNNENSNNSNKNVVEISDVNIAMINYLISFIYNYNNKLICDNKINNIYDKIPRYIQCVLIDWSQNVTNIAFNSYNNSKIVSNINIYCNNNKYNNIVQFDKLNVMFKQMKCICIDYAKYITVEHWNIIKHMLNNINQLKYSKLNEIYIVHRDYGKEINEKWDIIENIIKNTKWQLVDVESKAICITRKQSQ